MALSANSVWEVRPTNGSDTACGGGFVRGASGTDFSQQNAKNTVGNNISTADVVSTGVATITSATASFTSAIVGNIIRLSGSGVTTGYYQVVTFTNSTTVILDRSPGTGTSGTMSIGGALATINQAINTNTATGHCIFVKAESTITFSSSQTWNPASNGQFSFIAGYTTTRGDNGKVTIQASGGSSFTLVTLNNNGSSGNYWVKNFIFDANSKTSVSCFSLQDNGGAVMNCNGINQTGGTAVFDINNNGSTGGTGVSLSVSGCSGVIGIRTTSSNLQSTLLYCRVTGLSGTATAYQLAEGSYIGCIADNCAGSTTDGFKITSTQRPVVLIGCVAYKCGRDGVRFDATFTPAYPISIANTIAYGNAGWQINNASGVTVPPLGGFIDFNAADASGSGQATGLTWGPNSATLTADPFTNGASNDFSLNSTAGGGALCRSVGFPGTLNSGGAGFTDIGTLRHQDPAGGGGMLYVPNLEGT